MRLIDINDLKELSYIREEGGEVRIGAMTRHVELLKSELLAEHLPLFRDAENVIADPIVRNRGTIGGSLCQADAAEDLSAVCSAVRASVVIRGHRRACRPDEDFHVGPYMTAVRRRRAADGDADPLAPAAAAPTRRWSAVPATGRSRLRRPRSGSTAARSPTRESRSAPSDSRSSMFTRQRSCCGARLHRTTLSQAGEIASAHCSPGPTDAARSTTSATSPAGHETRPARRDRARPRSGGLDEGTSRSR